MARETETARVAVANNRNNSSGNEIAEAREVAEWIQSSGDIFLERLISHLSQLPRLQTVPAAYLYDPSKHESTETSKENSSGGNECSGKQNDDGGDGDGDGGSGIARTSKQSATLKPSRKWVFCNALGCDALLLVIGTDDNDRRSAG
mmetsp:Transcript_7024/g.20419  ORF Transcript_7024/g.20419 Transcript_7024/m.20419 type:complete len:147 (-) Transcript_7024:285-725(-)